MPNARIFCKSAANGIHRDNIFREIVRQVLQVAELTRHSLFRTEQISDLDINGLFSACGYKVYLSFPENTSRYPESEDGKMMQDNIFHHFLDAVAQIESTEQVAQPVIGKVIFIVLFENALPVNVIAWNRFHDECAAEVSQVCGGEDVGNFLSLRFHHIRNVARGYEFPDIVGYKGGQILYERHVADFLTRNDIAQHNSIVNSLQIVSYLALIFYVVMAQTGKTSDAQVVLQALV